MVLLVTFLTDELFEPDAQQQSMIALVSVWPSEVPRSMFVEAEIFQCFTHLKNNSCVKVTIPGTIGKKLN